MDNAISVKACRLPAVFDLRNAKEVRDQLVPLLSGSGDLELDGSAVMRISTAGVQLLAALKHELGRRTRGMIIHQPSQALIQTVDALGLKALLTSPAPNRPP